MAASVIPQIKYKRKKSVWAWEFLPYSKLLLNKCHLWSEMELMELLPTLALGQANTSANAFLPARTFSLPHIKPQSALELVSKSESLSYESCLWQHQLYNSQSLIGFMRLSQSYSASQL